MYTIKQVRSSAAAGRGHVSIKETRGSAVMDRAAGIIEHKTLELEDPSAASLISKVFSP